MKQLQDELEIALENDEIEIKVEDDVIVFRHRNFPTEFEVDGLGNGFTVHQRFDGMPIESNESCHVCEDQNSLTEKIRSLLLDVHNQNYDDVCEYLYEEALLSSINLGNLKDKAEMSTDDSQTFVESIIDEKISELFENSVSKLK
ncbi:hypothetical protein [Vibrio alginolyticus]|uniref:hypothetical protein n=1 Tax=Vibrio alginolyticus TaxID=663 RepID=UPI001BD6CF38|nr:hypothetical protein [Vibrio alginolyticus]MBS9935800.1 hypothetical protein [Vibrio alginolyticus]